MSTLYRETTCKLCGEPITVPRFFVHGVERFAGVPIACDLCAAEIERQRSEIKAAEAWADLWTRRMPVTYQHANEADLREHWRAILRWNDDAFGGCGLIGPSGTGKSCAVACLIKRLRRPFLWWSGTEARQAATDAATQQEDRAGARRRWEHGMTVPVLVLDDISQAKFTEAWGANLFDLLETRLSHSRPTFWTSQISLERLREKMRSHAIEDEQAAAICRRLAQHSLRLVV